MATSPLKPLKWYKNLSTLKDRLVATSFLLEGDRAIRQVYINHPASIIEILHTEAVTPGYDEYPHRCLTAGQLRDISSSTTPQGIIAVVKLPVETYSHELPQSPGKHILLLEDIQDPGNVGTLIRTAAAFGFSGIILSNKCADPFLPKCVQSTAGSILSLWLRRTDNYVNLMQSLIRQDYTLIAADLQGEDRPYIFDKSGQLILALGNEAAGLSEPLLRKAHYRIKIPIDRTRAESLNVAISGAICMYLASRNQSKSP